MAEPFMGQIITVGFNFAPRGFAQCNGTLLSISEYDALYALLGTTYGGDGVTTFAIPDLRGRAAINQGKGPGLTQRNIGQMSGEVTHTLTTTEMPAHSHHVTASNRTASSASPENMFYAQDPNVGATIYSTAASNTTMNTHMVSTAGGSQPHENMQPFLVINFCIALEGIFPSQN